MSENEKSWLQKARLCSAESHCNNECTLTHLLHPLAKKSITYIMQNVQSGPVVWLSKIWTIYLKAYSPHWKFTSQDFSLNCACVSGVAISVCPLVWVSRSSVNQNLGPFWFWVLCRLYLGWERLQGISLKPGFYQFHCWVRTLFHNKEMNFGLQAYTALLTNCKGCERAGFLFGGDDGCNTYLVLLLSFKLFKNNVQGVLPQSVHKHSTSVCKEQSLPQV